MKECAILSWLIVIHLLKERGQTRFQLVLVHDQRLHHHLLIPLCPFNGWLAKPRVGCEALLHSILIFLICTQNAKQYLRYINWSESIRTPFNSSSCWTRAALPSSRWEPQHFWHCGLASHVSQTKRIHREFKGLRRGWRQCSRKRRKPKSNLGNESLVHCRVTVVSDIFFIQSMQKFPSKHRTPCRICLFW